MTLPLDEPRAAHFQTGGTSARRPDPSDSRAPGIRPSSRFAFSKEVLAEFEMMDAWATAAMLWGVAAVILGGFELTSAFITLFIASGFAWGAVRARRRADSLFARSLMAILAEPESETLAEAA